MTMQAFAHGLWLPTYPGAMTTNTPTMTTTGTMDGASEGIAMIFKANAAKNIHKVWFRTGTVVTGGANNLDIRIETVDGSGNPSGSLWAANTNISFDLVDGDDNKWCVATLTADATMAIGDAVALVIRNPAASFGNWSLRGTQRELCNFPYGAVDTAGSGAWAKVTNAVPLIFAEFSDGTFAVMSGVIELGETGSSVFNTGTSATTGTARGNKFQVPFPARAAGAWMVGTCAAGADFSIKIYASNGTSVLATTGTIDAEIGQNALKFYPFTATVDLAATTTYYLAVVSETANSITLYRFDAPSAAAMDLMPLGQNYYESAFISSAWADTTSGRTMIGVQLTGFDDGAGAGGGGGLKLAGCGGLAG